MADDIAWHFTGDRLRDGRPVPAIGETLTHEGPIEWCASGLYAARTPWQALQYAPGAMLHRVCVGRIEREDDGDKLVCRERTILASRDLTFTLRRFAADQALSVAHLWDMPDVVRDYLTTLDESKRAAAWAAAWAAGDAARDAARAAGDAARDAARAAGDAAWAAAWAAGDAAWDAAWDAGDAAWDAAWDAGDAAWDAAWAAAWVGAGQEFNRRVEALFEDPRP